MVNNKNLTWEEIANDYDSCHSGSKARTLPMKDLFAWARRQTKRYRITKAGTVCYNEGKED